METKEPLKDHTKTTVSITINAAYVQWNRQTKQTYMYTQTYTHRDAQIDKHTDTTRHINRHTNTHKQTDIHT